jgi:hypothetical protein
MSGTVVAPLSDAEKVDVRRFGGFPAYGLGPTTDPFNRTFAAFTGMEFRINNLQPPELLVVRARLAALYTAETGLEAASGNLDTDQAAVWHHNKTEVADRTQHFDMLRRRLCQFLGIGPGPELSQSNRNVSLIV